MDWSLRATAAELEEMFPIGRNAWALLWELLYPVTDRQFVVPLRVMLWAGVYDWLVDYGGLEREENQRVLLRFKPHLAEVADAFDKSHEALGLSPVSLVILDHRFITLHGRMECFFDLTTSQWIEKLPHHALTMVSCDLNVLLVRLFGKLEWVRKQETDRASQPQSSDSHAAPQPPTAAADGSHQP